MKDTTTFQIRTYVPEHTCARTNKNIFCTASWMSNKYLEEFKDNDSWSSIKFMNKIQKDLILDCSRTKAWRTKKKALEIIEGSYAHQYARLWDYEAELKKTNPGTTIEFLTEADEEGNPIFRRLYICYGGCKAGFKAGCRAVIGLDGCHIEGHHSGQLLTAVGIDPNNGMFPVAFAVVESECKDSWAWFLNYLRDDINIYNGYHWTFITDKQKGLIEALNGMWEEGSVQAEHRHCARHLQSNFTRVK